MKLALFLIAALLAILTSFAPAVRAQAPAKTPKKKPAAAKPKKKAEESRYKTTMLAGSLDGHYRYDENGDPVDAKKPASSAKKKAPAPVDDADKTNSDADSL